MDSDGIAAPVETLAFALEYLDFDDRPSSLKSNMPVGNRVLVVLVRASYTYQMALIDISLMLL